ncbi:hypothetical protein QP045_12585, partial [Sphingomonas sp. 3-13AW]
PRQAPPPPPPALAETAAIAARKAEEQAERQHARNVTMATIAGVGIGAVAVGALLLLSRDSEAPKTAAKTKKAGKKA